MANFSHPNDFEMSHNEFELKQEITLVNDGTVAWPCDAHMKLMEFTPGLNLPKDIIFGAEVTPAS